MIVTKEGKTKLEGTMAELLADVTSIATAINNAFTEKGFGSEKTKERLHESIDDAFLTTKELESKVVEALEELVKKFLNMEG